MDSVDVAITQATSAAAADVFIVGYWTEDPIDRHCKGSIACIEMKGPYPHFSGGRFLWLEERPHWGHEDDPRTWTDEFQHWSRNRWTSQYLPAVLMHEFGHAIGLEHSVYLRARIEGADIMAGATRELAPCSVAEHDECGLSLTDKRGARGIYTQHTKH